MRCWLRQDVSAQGLQSAILLDALQESTGKKRVRQAAIEGSTSFQRTNSVSRGEQTVGPIMLDNGQMTTQVVDFKSDISGILTNASDSVDFTEPVTLEFYLGVTRCPNASAKYATHLRQRGHDDWPEITCWPKQEHNRLTTGREFKTLGIPQPVSLTETEKQMCAILGLNELELGIFLREWIPTSADQRSIGNKQIKSYVTKTGTRPTDLEDLLHAYYVAGRQR